MNRGKNKKVLIIIGIFVFVFMSQDNLSAKPKAISYNPPLVDPDIYVDIYKPDLACKGTTLFSEYHNRQRPRIVEVNMRGELLWEYVLPENLIRYTNPGFDVEHLANNNVLFVLPLKGVYEIDRDGNIVWSYLTSKISHDADRLTNGNTLIAWGGGDSKSDAQVREITPQKKVVWSWRAKDHFDKPPFSQISRQGWTHTNSVSRLANGNTLISLRNFDLVIEVDHKGEVIWSFDCKEFGQHPHEPEIEGNGNMLFTVHKRGWDPALEIDRESGQVVWNFRMPEVDLVRDVDRLPNGNTLIVGRAEIVEVNPQGEVVWRLGVKGILEDKSPGKPKDDVSGYLYKAERIPQN
ncbi:MAG: aryl-sulfate sulfotransferase [Candidatus Omnitrophota bacterium]